MSETMIWPSFRYSDAHAAIRFLVDAFGFERVAVYENGDRVDHAELRWPLGGGVMLGSSSARTAPSPVWQGRHRIGLRRDR